jgi:hypothetical protein
MRSPAHRKSHLSLAIVLATGNVLAQPPESDGETYAISEDVIAQAEPHLARAPDAQLPAMSFIQTIWNKGNFGKAVYADGTYRFTPLDSGLLQVEGSGGFRHAEATGKVTNISLCGLVSLLSISQSSTTSKGLIPVNGIGILISTSSTVKIAAKSRVTRLESSTASLCNIAAGETFTLEFDTETTRAVEGKFIRDKTTQTTGSSALSCTVSKAADPASRIAPFLTGDALTVTCESFDVKKRPVMTRYSYLIDYRYYLPIADQSKWQRSETAYSTSDAMQGATQDTDHPVPE